MGPVRQGELEHILDVAQPQPQLDHRTPGTVLIRLLKNANEFLHFAFDSLRRVFQLHIKSNPVIPIALEGDEILRMQRARLRTRIHPGDDRRSGRIYPDTFEFSHHHLAVVGNNALHRRHLAFTSCRHLSDRAQCLQLARHGSN